MSFEQIWLPSLMADHLWKYLLSFILILFCFLEYRKCTYHMDIIFLVWLELAATSCFSMWSKPAESANPLQSLSFPSLVSNIRVWLRCCPSFSIVEYLKTKRLWNIKPSNTFHFNWLLLLKILPCQTFWWDFSPKPRWENSEK